jgi:hypothetical protein
MRLGLVLLWSREDNSNYYYGLLGSRPPPPPCIGKIGIVSHRQLKIENRNRLVNLAGRNWQ